MANQKSRAKLGLSLRAKMEEITFAAATKNACMTTPSTNIYAASSLERERFPHSPGARISMAREIMPA